MDKKFSMLTKRESRNDDSTRLVNVPPVLDSGDYEDDDSVKTDTPTRFEGRSSPHVIQRLVDAVKALQGK